MLDKDSSEWANVPFWVGLGMWGMKTRKAALAFEYFCFVFASIAFVASFFYFPLIFASVLWGSAYWYAITIRWIDNAGLWQQNT